MKKINYEAQQRNALEALRNLFSQSPINLWVMTYGISHQVMLIGVFDTNFTERVEILLGDCTYFSGEFKGAPYSDIQITQSAAQHGLYNFVIIDRDNRIEIHCKRLGEPKDWRERFEK